MPLSKALTTDQVQKAVAGEISTPMLEMACEVARQMHHSNITEAEATLVCLLMAPCFEELLNHRRRAATGLELVPSDNVVPLHGPEVQS